MNTRVALWVLAGSATVNLVLAACTATSKSASADATPPAAVQVAEEPCDKTFTVSMPGGPNAGATSTVHYAEHAYPGMSKFDIAGHVTHWTPITDPNLDMRPTGYEIQLQSAVYTKDGFAGAGCEEGQTTYFIWHP